MNLPKVIKTPPYPDVLPEVYFQQFTFRIPDFKTLCCRKMSTSSGGFISKYFQKGMRIEKDNPKEQNVHIPYFTRTKCHRRHFEGLRPFLQRLPQILFHHKYLLMSSTFNPQLSN